MANLQLELSVLNHLDLGGVHFTGSTYVFSTIWLAIGSDIRKYFSYPRIVGETGGKDFIFAHPSADLTCLVTAAVRGAFEYQGQKCSAPSRLYVPTRDGLVMLAIDGSTLSYQCSHVRPKDCRRVCGPPMAWLGGLLFPYVDTNGHFALAHVTDERNPHGVKRVPSMTEAQLSTDEGMWLAFVANPALVDRIPEPVRAEIAALEQRIRAGELEVPRGAF